MLKMKRIYETASEEDGYRIFVDKLWARGRTKEEAKIDYWAKGITPTTKIRREFNHEADKFEEFKEKYVNELNTNEQTKTFLDTIRDKLKLGDVTLVYGAKDPNINHVVILKKWIEDRL